MLDEAAAVEFASEVWRRGLRPEPELTVSEWADRFRFLPSTSAEPGRWRTDRTPYLREIMDALSVGSPYERVVLMKGAQVGGTEAGLNWLAYLISHAPGLALLVMPSLDMIKRNTRTRIDPLIEATDALSKLVYTPRARDAGNTMFHKGFPGGSLVMTGANSAAALRSTPARYLFLDEVDGFPNDVDGEGDPVDLAIKRTVTYRGRRKVLMVSTPTLKGSSRIEAAYEESDQRKYFVPCLHCGDMAPITWARIRWPEGQRHDAYLLCEACGGVMDERDKPELLARGGWRAPATADGPTAGSHLSSLYSPFELWGAIAIEHGKVHRDPARLQVWCNTALAETWEDTGGEQLDAETLMARREANRPELPEGVAVLTCGVDVQNDRLEAQLVGWGYGEECWIVDYRVFPGDPSGGHVWEQLDRYLLETWPHALIPQSFEIKATCIDSGGHHTRAAYEFTRRRMRRRVWAIKGRGGQGVSVWPKEPSRNTKGRAPIFNVGVDALKDTLAARLRVGEPGPGYIHFAADLTPGYFQQLTAERRVRRFIRGREKRTWELRSGKARNEALDTMVYATAALNGLYALGLDIDAEALRLQESVEVRQRTSALSDIKSKWMAR